MKCPHCNSDAIRVVETFPGASNTFYRRRKCKECGKPFRTVEVIDNGGESFARGYHLAFKRKQLKRIKKENNDEQQ